MTAYGHREFLCGFLLRIFYFEEVLIVPVARLNGTSLYYETYGRGTPLIFLHGHGWTHTMFKPQIDYFSQKYRVILCDLRGNGKSGPLSQSPDHIMDTQCLDIIMLMNDLNIRDAVFVGISYGGLAVQHIAKHYPERVRAMVVVDSFCGSEAASLAGKLYRLAAYCSLLTYYAPHELMMPSVRLMYRHFGMAYGELRRSLREKRPWELYRQRLAMARLDYSAHLKRLNLPALCVAGDGMEYGVHCMKEMARRLPHGELAIIPDSLDPSNLCQPELFNRILQQFLEKQHMEQPTG